MFLWLSQGPHVRDYRLRMQRFVAHTVKNVQFSKCEHKTRQFKETKAPYNTLASSLCFEFLSFVLGQNQIYAGAVK